MVVLPIFLLALQNSEADYFEIIDFSPPWRRVQLREELSSHTGIDLDAYPDHGPLAQRVAERPRFGLALTKKAVNQAEDRMGLRDSMDGAFALHHLAHAHNALTSDDHLQGQSVDSMKKGLE